MDPPPDRLILQPLHSSMRSKLSREYVDFHDTVLQYIPPSESLPFDPIKSRAQVSPFAKTGLPNVEVGNVQDCNVGKWQIRIFTPPGKEAEVENREAESKEWPALLWFHGGGYVMGGLGSENSFLRFICRHVSCIVLSVNYRHAPEHTYPAAINDCISSLQHLSSSLLSEINIDPARVAIGGLSAGGQLAASTALWAAEQDEDIVRLCFQILICPVLENTANPETRWSQSKHAPWLTPGRMAWYREKYLLSEEDAANWLASPVLAPPELLAKSPPTFIAISGCDLLAPEGLEFAKRMKEGGVSVETNVYAGATHSILVLAGVHEQGKKAVRDACGALAKAFGVEVDEKMVKEALGMK